MTSVARVSEKVNEGKTKILHRAGTGIVSIESKDDLTARNGKKHDILPGKGVLATETTCNVFELLRHRKLPLAFMRRTGGRTFQARECAMVSLEVVVRFEVAKGSSYAKRHPRTEGHRFTNPEVEFYLKTTRCHWVAKDGKSYTLPVDDPYLVWGIQDRRFFAYDPTKATGDQQALLEVTLGDLGLTPEDLAFIESVALDAGKVLAEAWEEGASGRLKDLKMEFGWTTLEKLGPQVLVIADVIDNDSWRLEIDGKEVSKEIYRQDAPLDEVMRCYQLVSDLSGCFLDMIA